MEPSNEEKRKKEDGRGGNKRRADSSAENYKTKKGLKTEYRGTLYKGEKQESRGGRAMRKNGRR